MISEEEIKRFQGILLLVRKCVGWSAEELGDRIGVTRQTINNLESGRCKLNKTQYIAMRSVLDKEMEEFPEETEMLKVVLDAFVDNPDGYSEESKQEIFKKAMLLSPAISSDPSNRKEVSKEWIAILVSLGILGPLAVPALLIGLWRKKL